MGDNLENFEGGNDEISDDIEGRETDGEISFDSSEIKRKVIPVRAPSVVWQYFEKLYDDNGVHSQSKCNFCGQNYSAGCSTTTLNDHWKNKHSKIQPGGTGSIEMAFNTSVKSKGEEHLEHLSRLTNWVILEYQPFREVDSSSFRDFVNGLNPGFKVPSRQTLRNKIDEKYIHYKNSIIKLFQENESKIAFTSDMWTSDTGAPYMVLTGHWVDNEWNLRHAIIAFQRLPHPHTGEEIQKATLNIFKEFSIATKALAITIDNGANQVSGMNKLSIVLSKELKVEFNVLRCGAHTIALVVNAGLSKFKPIIDKVRSFVIEIRKSPKKEQELSSLAHNLKIKYKKLIRDVKTRWNSTYSMLEAFLENKAIINAVISLNKVNNFSLTENEWTEIKLFCDFLKPFYEFTVEMSGSEYPTLGMLLLFLDYLQDHLNTTIQNNESQVPTWIKDIAKAMREKFDSISYNLNNSAAYLALVLDPRYKTQIIPNNIDVEMAKSALLAEFNSYQVLVESEKNNEENKISSVGEKRKSQGIMEHILQKKKKANSLSFHNEVEEYLAVSIESQSVNPCEWWRDHKMQYPILAKIARDYICIPATSVPSEQAFSKSGELISKRRNRLGDRAIEACMCLNSWIALLDRNKKI